MFSKISISFVALSMLASSEQVMGRMQWLERDNKAIFLHPRRFGQERPAVIDKLSAACAGEVCGVLAGAAITPLLAAQGECTQQDMADQIIDAAAQFDAETEANMIAIAIEYRQAEKNTPPDFSTNPPANRNSVFCQKAPKNAQLNGLVQAQDPANDPNLFFDPATQSTVTLGSQANTVPFGGEASAIVDDEDEDATSTSADAASSSAITVTVEGPSSTEVNDLEPCTTVVTVTVTAREEEATEDATTTTASDAAATTTPAAIVGDIGDFGSCSIPEIEFGTGFDGRVETSFQPVDKTSFNHGSAQNGAIISEFICDELVNSCGADATARETCATAEAALALNNKSGVGADAFNAVFGIETNFADVASIDNQGNVVPGTGNDAFASTGAAATSTGADASSTGAAASSTEAVASTTATADAEESTTPTTGGGDIGDFGSCSIPEIEFGVGFDNRKETSFRPKDLTSFNHGSAQAPGIIAEFICDQLVNSCGADQTARDTCATAEAALGGAPAKTGGQADLFNAVFGITTNFADVQAIDDQGRPVTA